MDVARITKLRDHIAALPEERFTMTNLVAKWATGGWPSPYRPEDLSVRRATNECGTAACIAGWTYALFSPRTQVNNMDANKAGELLGLDHLQAQDLFTPPGFLDPAIYTQQQAIETLDRLIETGEVVW